jgi:hypothetical protein
MYDELSLKDLLEELGFVDVRRETPTTSRIPGWSDYHLDADADGTQYKGVSLYLEGTKPNSSPSS